MEWLEDPFDAVVREVADLRAWAAASGSRAWILLVVGAMILVPALIGVIRTW